MHKWLKECRRILSKNGTIWVIGAFQNIYRIGYVMQNLGFWILNDVICQTKEDGSVYDDQEVTSIHKMSAKYLNKTNNNGWDYFYILQNDKLIALDSLRYKYAEEKSNYE